MNKQLLILTILSLCCAASATAQSGGGYAITQAVIASGGASNSTGGTYALAGTIGQPVAGQPASGGTFNVSAGFWSPSNFAPTAAGASIGGRVTAANGAGIRNVVVTLNGAGGELRTTVSGASGYFNFDDVPTGAIYIISVSAKRYRFVQSSQIVSLNENVTDMIFVATTSNYIPLTTIITEPRD